MKLRHILPIALLSVTASAVSADPMDNFTKDFKPQVYGAYADWYKKDITNYSYIYTYSCFCIDAGIPFRVDVLNNEVKNVVNTSTGAVVPEDRRGMFKTIDNLFAELMQANGNAHIINAKFDKRWSHPKSVYIDRHPQIADEEIGYTISKIYPMMP
ncbi:hypothetical protein KCM76_12000 [Zooshikella marina]|uniref:Uncharacterized protein n=1 Tax=Zooshikella ganghwensis TaxID=202772 RepID=A0A4P9VKU6_9GAMM|nr:DUF6174 domain-containing protein [Zooshikella ganghwensis]MBU2706706.1 hypothetical protein [Zooshikella ganghwensis]RDH43935.1 hypothetical protein B9G39_11035 [Zooshikella ganghwensis]